MALNDNYNFLASEAYYPGMIADARYTQTVSRIAGAQVIAGRAVVRNGDDHKVKHISAASEIVQGVVRWEATWENSADGLDNQAHNIGKDVSVVTSGPVLVNAAIAVTQGEYAYALADGSGFTNSPTSAATRPVGIFDTSTTGVGVVIVNLIPGMTAPAASA